MQPLIIAPEAEYRGKYVALQSFQNKSVVASGFNAKSVLEEAKLRGFSAPVIVHIPAEKTLNLFNLF